MQFLKMNSYGNDFVVFGSPCETDIPSKEYIEFLCDRHYGIGADCAVFIGKSDRSDYFMHVFNPDGFEAEMCGNALRCSGIYVAKRGYSFKKSFTVETRSGEKTVFTEGNTSKAFIANPFSVSNGFIVLGGTKYKYYEISTGNPHCVVLTDNISDKDFNKFGKILENHSLFKNGTNVEFASILRDGTIKMRVWERGIGETLCCVTGSCACAKAAIEEGIIKDKYSVIQKGGTIDVEVRGCGNMFVGGECNIAFGGNTEI